MINPRTLFLRSQHDFHVVSKISFFVNEWAELNQTCMIGHGNRDYKDLIFKLTVQYR